MMYAIVDIAGQQFRVEKDQKIFVHRQEGEAGSKLDFDKVMLIDNNQNVTVGSPVIEGAMVYASIVDHLKGDKVLIFKKKRRKGYRVKNGHRQHFTQILIEDIIETGAKRRVKVKETKPVTIKEKKKEVIVAEEVPAAQKPVKEAVSTTQVKQKPATKAGVKKTSKPEVKKTAEKKPVSKAAEKKTGKPSAKAAAEKKSAAKPSAKATAEKKPAAKPAAKSAKVEKKENSKKTKK